MFDGGPLIYNSAVRFVSYACIVSLPPYWKKHTLNPKGSESMNEREIFEDIKKLLDSEALVTARLVESIAKTSQLAAASSPEVAELFGQWLSLVGGEVKRMARPGEELSVNEAAETIGITPVSLLSLLLLLQRRGEITLESVKIGQGTGQNEDVCDCLMA